MYVFMYVRMYVCKASISRKFSILIGFHFKNRIKIESFLVKLRLSIFDSIYVDISQFCCRPNKIEKNIYRCALTMFL